MEQKRTIVGIYDHWLNQESYIHVNDGTQHRIASIKYSEMFIACTVTAESCPAFLNPSYGPLIASAVKTHVRKERWMLVYRKILHCHLCHI